MEIAGQEPITRAIKNSLRENKLSHAYLFTGPRGVGKTTIAKYIGVGERTIRNEIKRGKVLQQDSMYDFKKKGSLSTRGVKK